MTLTHTGAAPRRLLPALTLPALSRLRRPAAHTQLLLGIIAALAVWGTAIGLFGYAALILPLLLAVPAMFAVLVWITWG